MVCHARLIIERDRQDARLIKGYIDIHQDAIMFLQQQPAEAQGPE
jgi:hypothetical protein